MKLYQSLFVLFGLIVVARAANFYEFDLDDPYSPIFNG
jgi:predicted secreted protein